MTEASVRVIAPDMGGGFGNKQHFLREECLVALLARIAGVPVRWEEDRTEALTASVHSRPQVHDVTAAYDDDGRLLALSVDVTSDVGNPVLYFSGIGPSLVTVGALCGAYAVPEHGWTLSCVATTTCPVGAYRGFGQPQAHLTIERVMDRIAQSLGLDPVEVRRRNLLPDDAPRPFTGARRRAGRRRAPRARSSSSCSTSSGTTRGGHASRTRAATGGTSGSASRCWCRAARRRSTAWPVASDRGRWRRSRCCPTGA